MSRVTRRGFVALLGTATLCWAVPAFAGSYLDRAALMLQQAATDADFLRARLSDKELARVVHKMASARVDAASHMIVPKEVTQAHPHLLLVLENYERAAEFAKDGKAEKFLIYQLRAQEEERILKGVLKQLGWSLPPVR
ncbi:MAG: hypothetical protein H6717_36190 [Polyangiaceae bacterium]|nr:hypothetical protein [Polyangiaceae bacterium]